MVVDFFEQLSLGFRFFEAAQTTSWSTLGADKVHNLERFIQEILRGYGSFASLIARARLPPQSESSDLVGDSLCMISFCISI
jgi:hypothetical protein